MPCPQTQTKMGGKIESSKNIIFLYLHLLVPPLYFSFAEGLKRDFTVAEIKFKERTLAELFKRSFLWNVE